MAAQPLFDISKIDLNQVDISSEEVGQINPQSGDMRHLDHVIWLEDNFEHSLGVKHVRHDEFWVEGHIPGRPLLPGVLMIEAAAQLCSIVHRSRPETDNNQFVGFTRCDEVAFRGQVVPGDTFYILVEEISHKPKRFISATQGIVNGSIVFEAKITGMVL